MGAASSNTADVSAPIPSHEPLTLRSKFTADILWNMLSVFVMGVCGVAMLAVIRNTMGYAILGVFNLVFTVYLFLSQVTVGGIHFSVLKHVSYVQQDRKTCTDIAVSGMLAALALSVTVCVLAFFLRGYAGAFFDSPAVATGLAFALPGLVFQSENKVMVNILNGLRHMRAYAIFQTLRFVFYLAGAVAIALLRVPPVALPIILTMSEFLLAVSLFVYVQGWVLPMRRPRGLAMWLREHASYGLRGFLSGTLVEMNARVDVLMLGFFCADKTLVGVYSLPAMIVEGMGQLPFTIRKNVDPLLGARFAAHDRDGIHALARKVSRVVYLAFGALGLIAVAGYPLGLLVIAGKASLLASWACFAILIAGLVCASGYRCFGGVLLQGGRPGLQTWLTAAVVCVNFALNALLVRQMGIYGAAAASSLAAVLDVALLVVLARIFLRVRL